MPEQPFEEQDVRLRWQTTDEDGPINKCAVETEYGLLMYWQPTGKKWHQVQPGNCDIAELLRQLIEAKKERDRLAGVMQTTAITLRQEFAGADDKEMEMAFGVADNLSASIVQPQTPDGGKE